MDKLIDVPAVWNYLMDYNVSISYNQTVPTGDMVAVNIITCFIGTTLVMVLAIFVDPNFEPWRLYWKEKFRKVFK